MSELKIKGRITKILNVESGTSKAGKEWKKGGLVIDTGSQYNPEVCLSAFGDDKLDMLSSHKEGSEVEVSFNVSSREYNGKYFHNLDMWKISGATASTPNPDLNNSDTETQDLPF